MSFGVNKYQLPHNLNEPFTNVSLVSTAVLQSMVNSIRNKNVKETSVEELEKYFENILSYPFYMVVNYFYPYYYRAQITTSSNIDRLINPKSHFVTKPGRCNYIGESLFYCSNCYVTSILEIKPKLNDIVTVLMLELDDDNSERMKIPLVPLAKDKLNDDLLYPFISSGSTSTNNKLKLVYDLLDAIMIQDVNDGEEWKYKKSASLVKGIFKKFDYPVGVAFPSKASKHFGVNFAIPPEIINNTGAKYKAFRIKIIKQSGDFNSVGLLTEIAKEKDKDGNFLFRNVDKYNYFINLNKNFFDGYENIFKAQKALQEKGAFFRRHYPPPQLPSPDNLVNENKIIFLNPNDPIIPREYAGKFPISMKDPVWSEKKK